MGTMLHGEACRRGVFIQGEYVAFPILHVAALPEATQHSTTAAVDCRYYCTMTKVPLRCTEMAHNVISPHNAEFFKLWDELWEVRRLLSTAHPSLTACAAALHDTL
jgi:WLM domain